MQHLEHHPFGRSLVDSQAVSACMNTHHHSHPQTRFNAASFPAQAAQGQQRILFDGKRMRKAITRRTVDHSSSVLRWLETIPGMKKAPVLQPDPAYVYNVR